MAILELRILPPIAIGRLGSSPTPLEAFDLEIPQDNPLDYRQIVPRETFRIDPESGAIAECYTPEKIRFKEPNGQIRPVAPFLEVFARTDSNSDELVPLTINLLQSEGLSVENISWNVKIGNIKIFRRTGCTEDKIIARIKEIRDHQKYELLGECENFLPGKKLPLGFVQFIKPTEQFPEIRFRYTPAGGKVYGSSLKRYTAPGKKEDDPIINSEDLVLYDKNKGSWRGYIDKSSPKLTNPAQIYAGYPDNDGNQVSWGYLDDECDGFVTVRLKISEENTLAAQAHISAGPPAFAPDTLPIRVVSDELEQILLGPEVQGEVSTEEALDIVRRALETVRLMNTAVMNGNSINGRENVASTMVRQDTNDFERLYEPIMATSLVDNLAVRALHERVFSTLSAGSAVWFADLLRRPEEIGDLSNKARRKMTALMRGADGRALTFTRRQIDTLVKAASKALFQASEAEQKT
ncbi:MAG: hypothetical protein JNN15_13005, partial [Blastocatellia bacterium]|nr:hypothetical protein [Blastocatellia bacterium]